MSNYPPKAPKFPIISVEAIEAIVRGIEDEHPLCNLEDLCKDGAGNPCLSQRTINLLENAGIITLEELMFTKKEKLMALPNLGPEGLKTIFIALSKYDEFSEEI
jgi:DNA-directed RNA polymerase alpha subunit